MNNNKDEIVLFENGELALEVNVSPQLETVWLSSNQMALLYGRDEKPFESMSTRFLPMENWNERATRKKCVLLVSVSRLLSITSMSSYPLDTVSIQSRASLFVNGQTPS